MIIGITGTLGAGKGTVRDYLVNQKGFKYFSARDLFIEELEKRGMPINRDTIVQIANDLRAQYGSGYFAETSLARAGESDAVLESIRSIGEAQYLKSHGAQLWAVDADIRARYTRVTERKSETDHVSLEKFIADEKREWNNADPSKQNLQTVIAMADLKLLNNGTPEELYAQVEKALQNMPS